MTDDATGPAETPRPPVPADAEDLAVNRVRFLTADKPQHNRVRPAILASWQRSRDAGIAADRVQVPFLRDPDVDTPLTRSAEPVLQRLVDRLADHAVSIILTDPTGLVLTRRTPDHGFERQLDRVLLAPGFSYAERYAGTNGIGTTLETGLATTVLGHEHYAENLERLACAAAPIHDPATGRLAGVLDLTCWRRDTDALLLTLAETTAEQIQHAMGAAATHHELVLLQTFRRTCQRTSVPVLAIGADAVTVNDRGRTELTADEQRHVVAHAVEGGAALAPDARRSLDVVLPTGRAARLHCRRVGVDDQGVGVVVQVRFAGTSGEVSARLAALETAAAHTPATPTAIGATTPATSPAAAADPTPDPTTVRRPDGETVELSGLVGSSLPWRRAVAQAHAAARSGQPLVLRGEPSTGKRALAEALVREAVPGASGAAPGTARPGTAQRGTARLDARASGPRRWLRHLTTELATADRIVLAHADELPAAQAGEVGAVLAQAVARGTWVCLTATSPPAHALAEVAASVVEVPPLRLRADDVPALTEQLLATLGHRTALSCAPDALAALSRATWPGNIEHLRTVLSEVVSRRHHGTITAADLPADLGGSTRRVLSPLEALEREAIVGALAESHGDKRVAARRLGISRATIYRRIRDFGIAAP